MSNYSPGAMFHGATPTPHLAKSPPPPLWSISADLGDLGVDEAA